MTLLIQDTGPATFIQDGGRIGYAHQGVPKSGFADVTSAQLANRLVGNDSGAAAIEVSTGIAVRTEGPAVIAVTGAPVCVRVDGVAVGMDHARWLGPNSVLQVGIPQTGMRSYVAVRGGVRGPGEHPILGSWSVDVLSGFGRALVGGDILRIGAPQHPVPELDIAAVGDSSVDQHGGVVSLRCWLGPRDDVFIDPSALFVGYWTVGHRSNRVGVRVDRDEGAPELRFRRRGELPSEGVAHGSVQVPPSGQPVIFGPDHPVTGGYPVIAVLEPKARDRAMQLRPGQKVQFSQAQTQ